MVKRRKTDTGKESVKNGGGVVKDAADQINSTTPEAGARPSSTIIGISRSIAACQRCRQKKTKCDQKFPSCAKCEKAGVECVGLDPATGRQVPRSYVIYLEDKVAKLEEMLIQNGINPELKLSNGSAGGIGATPSSQVQTPTPSYQIPSTIDDSKDQDSSIKSSLTLAVPSSTNGNSGSFYIGDSSGISFAKLLFTAVNFQPSSSMSETGSITTKTPFKEFPAKNAITGLPIKPTAEFFIKTFFEQSNTQLPIIHREYFINNYYKPIYGNLSPNVTLASNYTQMNLDTSPIDEKDTWFYIQSSTNTPDEIPKVFQKPLFFLNLIFAIASSVNLLQYKAEISNSYRVEAMKFVEPIYSSADRLECLQGLLLLTQYSIMRPSTPGVWYVLGTTLRLVVDLGLHTERMNNQFTPFIKDMRRRLFWCAYSLDRQICFYLGRPFGIPEESISTKFPIELDDCLINLEDINDYAKASNSLPTYKLISLNFFKIRRIQSEILHVLYFPNSVLPRFYSNLNEWKLNIDQRLEVWFKTIPLKTSRKANCDFNFEFFRMNYNHTKLLLFGITPKNDKLDQNSIHIIFEASKNMILCYWDFYKTKSINYTWATVHNLFFASTSFFYSIFNSNNSLIQLIQFEKVVSQVKEILNSLVENCDAAKPCSETIDILYLAIKKLKFQNVNNEITSQQFYDIDRFFTQLNNPQESSIFKDFQYSSVFDDSQENSINHTNQPIQNNGNDINDEQFQFSQVANSQFQQPQMTYQSLSTPPLTSALDESFVQADREQQKIFEVMSKVSMDTIWDQFLGNGGFQ
ncbi:Pyrimidine pathway regulatory protein 1 [Wickerhamomyces ciferrii]|uniref:Pyrimidine pathway regulatory protein 1 n=1 Tax=Wickerhamomyces ciferrii (strain ATCC 14091 / BCRC 22168 / CBS 111 / JCM 3599 / NBRC 0793 / NRRL Y-1031 F-60-10) TaxID=1206466 RepID=K0KWG8_WICCF|nr:Pyrimidine pathway regulatory protein 1 [Wickerhamomyces ciferrii]CCH45839.1 Pyrimidine pathway regulatory protein 1 [Wickerhamomyces ciferrii]